MSTLRRIARTIDAHTLWAFNPHSQLSKRG
jgi:hypothetical protein